jgi:hypothetical protein
VKEINLSLKRFNYLTLVIFVYSILRLVEYRFEMNLPLLRYFFILLGAFFVLKLISITESLKNRFKGSVKLLVIIIIFFIFYSIFIGLPELTETNRNYINLKRFLGEKALLFLLPLLLFTRPNPQQWKYFIKYSYLLLLALVPLLLLDIIPFLTREKSPEGLIRTTAGTAGFFLLVSPYFTPLKRSLITSIYIISLLFMLFHARRNMVLYYSMFFLFYYYLVFFSENTLVRKSKTSTVLNTLFLVFIGAVVFLFGNPDFSLFVERSSTGFESREGVVEEFFSDITPFSADFYLGRGMFGTFYSSVFGDDRFTDFAEVGVGNRDLIENGYLQLILNFGSFFLIVFILLSFVAFFKGFFKSKNLLVKSCAALLFINLVDMIGYGLPQITFRYFLVWISIPVCFSYYFRNLSDLEIRKFIFQNG